MSADSLIHIIDSLKQSHVIIQNITNDKSYLETYFPFIAFFITSMITLITLVITIKANRGQMREDNLIKLRKEWIQEFRKMCIEVEILFEKVSDDENLFSGKVYEYIRELSSKYFHLKFMVTIDGQVLDYLFVLVNDYSNMVMEVDKTNKKDENYYKDLKNYEKLIWEFVEIRAKFNNTAEKIIQMQWSLINGTHKQFYESLMKVKDE